MMYQTMAPVLTVIAFLFQITKAAYDDLWTMPQAKVYLNTTVIVHDWSHTEFVSSSNCSWGSWTSCFILTAQAGFDDEAESGTYIDTLYINITDYIDIRTTFSWQFTHNISGTYFEFIVYNVIDEVRGIAMPIFEEFFDAEDTELNTIETSHFHLGEQTDPATQIQLRFRTWCDIGDCIDDQYLFLNDITVTGNATNSTVSPTSMPTSENVFIYESTLLWDGTATPNTDWNEWTRSNSVSVNIVSGSYCYLTSDPCARLFANSSKEEWNESWLKTPIINVSDYTDILLEFNVLSEEFTAGSVFTVDVETDEPSTHMVALYNMTELVCHTT